ncbi:hypothetical protein C8046_13055 [Serinibacter arcticus]|uniref:Cellulosomal protein n=2 Tax=Serinibacter arcticus TaxID=1655435 RepID=A0A2U1ZZY6_9MICO|nr:hypothetical protein C8046_13055 [Serinibacter arcticus]
MTTRPTTRPTSRTAAGRLTALGAAVAIALAGCAPATGDAAGSATASPAVATGEPGTFFDASTVHEIAIDVDDAALTTMLQTYLDSGDKEWITASVTIDGETYDGVGIKLKGNSTLRGVTVDTPAQDLPWRIRLDKFTDDSDVDGYTDLVVRASSSETSLNEAVALDLLEAAGLASERAVATRFSVNGSEEVVRLTLQNLDDTWTQENFADGSADAGSVLYKAEAGGDYSWRGEDGAAYAEAFEIEAGADDYAPLVELLDLANNASDADFAAQLPELLDVQQLARYLAFEDLIGNFDDISGPGNNSYLYWDAATEEFTVVAWDHNLAFGVANVGGGGGVTDGGGMPGAAGARAGGVPPGAGERPTDLPDGEAPVLPDGGLPDGGLPDGGMDGGRGGMTRSNPLVDRFLADDDLAALVDEAAADLQAELVDSGLLEDVVATWSSVLTDGASDLVPADVVTAEGDAITSFEPGSATGPGGGGPVAGGGRPGAGSGEQPAVPNREDEDGDAAASATT